MPSSAEELKAILTDAAFMKRVVVLLKLGKKWTWVKPLLQELDQLESSIFAERIGFLEQKIFRASELNSGNIPYFSLLLIRQSWPFLMP